LKIKILIGLIFLFLPLLFSYRIVFADTHIIINEIMYDPVGSDDNHEWIELFNNSSVTIDLTNWRFEEGGTQHRLTLKQGSISISQDGYAVIADNADTFLSEHPGFSGNLIDSSFSLSNTGEALKIRDNYNGNIIDEVTYTSDWGASGDSNSLQRKNDGDWIATVPTPGEQNANEQAPTSTPSPTLTLKPSPSPKSSSSQTSTKSPTPTPRVILTTTVKLPSPTSATKTTSQGQVLSLVEEATLPALLAATASSKSPQATTEASVKSSSVNFLGALFLILAVVIIIGILVFRFWKKRK